MDESDQDILNRYVYIILLKVLVYETGYPCLIFAVTAQPHISKICGCAHSLLAWAIQLHHGSDGDVEAGGKASIFLMIPKCCQAALQEVKFVRPHCGHAAQVLVHFANVLRPLSR